MRTVILAGGWGTRLSEETGTKPKPMVAIGSKPILWHIMKIYTTYGLNDFVICLGYQGYVIKEYFANYRLHMSDIVVDMRNKNTDVVDKGLEPWRISLVDTGEETLTGGRLKRVRDYLGDEDFCLTYGDGVADVDIAETIRFHRSHGGLATVTAVRPPARFGALKIESQKVVAFQEKPIDQGSWINGGFFVLNPKAIDYIDGDDTSWEREPMERLANDGELYAYYHRGYWQPMDTLRDKHGLERLWEAGSAPWKVWE